MKADPTAAAPRSGKKRSRDSPHRSSITKKQNRGQPSDRQARRFEAWAHGRTSPPEQHVSKAHGSSVSARPAEACPQQASATSPGPPTSTPDAKTSLAQGSARGRRGAMLVTAAGGTAPPSTACSPAGEQCSPGRAAQSPGNAARTPSAGGRSERSPPSPVGRNVAMYASTAAHRSTAGVQAKLPADLAVLLRMFGEDPNPNPNHVKGPAERWLAPVFSRLRCTYR